MTESTPTQMSANQLVAYNLRRAREKFRWTQELAAQRLERYIGRRWSKATFSAAETSTTSGRVREFTANEILAFAQVFEEPIAYFFMPPDGVEDVVCGPPPDAYHVPRAKLLEATHGLTLFDQVVLRDQIATLRRAADALAEVERQHGVKSEAGDEAAEPQKEEDDAKS